MQDSSQQLRENLITWECTGDSGNMIQEICHFFPSVFGRPSSVWVAVLSSSYVAQIGPWPSKNWPAPAPSTIQLDQTLSKYRVRINGSSMVKHPEIKSRSRHFLGGLQYPLVIWHSHGKWPIEIDGLPIKKWWFSMAMLNNQMVIVFFTVTFTEIPNVGNKSEKNHQTSII